MNKLCETVQAMTLITFIQENNNERLAIGVLASKPLIISHNYFYCSTSDNNRSSTEQDALFWWRCHVLLWRRGQSLSWNRVVSLRQITKYVYFKMLYRGSPAFFTFFINFRIVRSMEGRAHFLEFPALALISMRFKHGLTIHEYKTQPFRWTTLKKIPEVFNRECLVPRYIKKD